MVLLSLFLGVGNRGTLDPIDAALGYGGDLDDLETTVFGFTNSGRKKPNYFLTDHTDDIGYSPLPRYLNPSRIFLQRDGNHSSEKL